MKLPDLSDVVLSDVERAEVEKILKELLSKGNSDAYNQMMHLYYEEIPVSIDQFIEDPDLLGNTTDNGRAIFPYWRNALREILHGGKSYTEIIFAGAIGLGKSFVSCIIGSYLLYKLLCLRNPQSYYNLAPNSPITFAFFNIHKYLASGVAYGQFQGMLQSSPWFLRHGEVRGVKNKEYYPGKGINFIVGANPEHAIGQNIFFGMLDEMSFAKKPNADILKAGVMELYRSVKTRMTSRFTREGILQAKMILISSKRTDSDFLDQYAQQQKGNPDTYIVDEPQWVVKPKGTFAEKKFRLAVGSKSKKSIIIPDDDTHEDDDFLANGYTQVLHVPVDLKPRFEFDMDANLRDLAGVSTSVFTKFIAYDKLSKCYSSKLKNPFENPEPIIGLEDDTQLIDYYNDSLVPDWIKELPLYIHLDIAYSGDGYGIGCVADAGTKNHYKIQTGEQATDPVFIHVFSAKIKSPKGDQVSLEKVRQFIYWLKFTLGYNIKRVSTDGFMSADTRQAMITRGIDADLLSLDRAPCTGYLTMRTAIYERRFIMIEIPMLEDELVNLERNEMSQKVDHTQSSEKDASDGICGALWNASMHAVEYSPVSKSVEMLLKVNEADSYEESTEQELISQLSNIVRNKKVDDKKYLITEDDDIDQILEKVTGVSEESEKEKLTDSMKNYYASMGIII